MADINRRAGNGDCEGEGGERGERGKRGHRGHRGHDGHDGATGAMGAAGATGATGATGSAADAAIGLAYVYRPGGVPGGNVFTSWSALVAATQLVQGTKTIQFDDSIVSPIIIPGGTWDMSGPVQWWGFIKPGPSFVQVQFGDGVNPANDATFPNWLSIDGDMVVTNNNAVTSPFVVPPEGTVFSIGTRQISNASVVNIGPAVFFDGRPLNAFGYWGVRNNNTISGSTPAIDLGDNSPYFGTDTFDGCSLKAGMLLGGPTATVFTFHTSSSRLMQQDGFLGTLVSGNPTDTQSFPWQQMYVMPPAPAPASTVPFTGPDLGLNTLYRFNTTAGNIAQTLPVIKAAVPIGSDSAVPGALICTGMWLTIKNALGANAVNVSPAPGETIDDGAGPISIAAGRAMTFQADGQSNWIIVSAY